MVWCFLSPKDLGIPQERGRCFIYGQKDDDGKAALRQSRFVPFINSLKRKNGSRLRKRALSEFLLPEDDTEVKAEAAKLKRWDDAALQKHGSTDAGACGFTTMPPSMSKVASIGSLPCAMLATGADALTILSRRIAASSITTSPTGINTSCCTGPRRKQSRTRGIWRWRKPSR